MAYDATDGIKPYSGPAGGWGALKAVAAAIREEMGTSVGTRALLQMNQPSGVLIWKTKHPGVCPGAM